MQIRVWDNNLKVRLAGEAMYNMLFWMYFPFITVYFAVALGSRIAGIMMAVLPLFSMIGNLLGGALADRFGRRPVMLLGTMLQALMFAMFAVSPSHLLDYFAYVGVGFGGAMYRPASSAMVADLVPVEHRRQVFATYMTANNVGAVLGPALGAVFFFKYQQELLWTCALVMLLYFIAIFIMVHETLPNSTRSKGPSATKMHVFKEQWKSYGIILRDKVFLVYIFAGIFAMVPIMQLDLYLPVYVTQYVPAQSIWSWKGESFTLTSTEIFGALLGFNGFLFVVFILPVTKWFGRWKERNVFILSSLLSGFGTFALGFSTNIWFLFIMTIFFTFGEMVRTPVTQSFISRYAPEHARGQYMGADNLQYTIGKMVAPATVFLSGWLAPMGIFSIILVFAFISSLLYIWLFRIYTEPNRVDVPGWQSIQ
ncbi:MDR family MFS transporter [Paenibacillus puldeungensis]|uniref:MDR family MFS transporter n=1 Tax=Paenibacillus puldeungensis TaxID=696536 RepID=A0ABW3RY62_9BACL